MSDFKPIRLIAAAKKFNVGSGTVIEFLQTKGFEVEDSPRTKLDEAMYKELVKEFSGDESLKEEAEKIELGTVNKAVKIENGKPKEEIIETKKVEITAPKVVGTVDLGEKKKEEPAKTEKPVEEKVEEPVKETAPTTQKTEEKPTEKVKLTGPKVLGKVDLTSKQKKETPKKEAPKKQAKEKPQPKVEAKPVAKTEPKVEEKPAKKKIKEEPKEDFIATKKISLSGPKILGKIEIKEPVKKETTKKEVIKRGSQDSTRKRKRFKKSAKIDPKSDKFRFKKKKDEEQTVVSEKEIEEKIKATMAKLNAAAGGKNQRQKLRRQKRQGIQEREAQEQERQDKENAKLKVTEFVTVSELASLMDVAPTAIITKCFTLGVMVSINQRLDAEIIELVASEFDYEVEFITAQEQELLEDTPDAEEDLLARPPVVTIMGHVDHGKTSLLDYIRKANVVSGEAGGITQHIGAYDVETEGGKITFLDTPGHEAFTAMRARGTKLTDIAIIVIAADDDIMPQTKEAISHAQSAGVPMIFAINKIDKPNANPDKIKEKLSAMNLIVEEWGGKYQSQDLSAKTGLNVPELLEKILLEAELLELKANPNKAAIGSVVEAALDKGRGYVATLLVQNGTLNIGDFIVAGPHSGKIKAMFDHTGKKLKVAGPSAPVQILGLDGAPTAGEKFKMFDSEQEGKSIAVKRNQLDREQGMRTQKHITLDEIGRRLALGTFKELNIIIKGDVDGSLEALADSLIKLSTEEIQVNILHKAVGAITESDIMLASASDAIIIGFQVRPSNNARRIAENEGVEIRLYSVIYNAIEELKSAMEGMLEPTVEEKVTGNLEIQEVFKISKVGTIAGCMVTDGKIKNSAKVRIIRDGIVVYTGALESLRRFKDEVKEVVAGQDCGLNIKNYNDIKKGDVIEAYEEYEIQRKLK